MVSPRKYSFLCISDIHLGATNIHPEIMVEALNHYLVRMKDDPVDVIFINGDLFDRGLRWTDTIVPLVEEWVVNLLLSCVARGTALRVMEGTPYHDRGQNAIFDRFIHYLKLEGKIDFKYVDTVSIEYVEKIGAHVLYVPDGEVDTDHTFETVKTLLKEHGIDKVDHAMMHGTMDYQLPEVANTPKHNAENYLSVVKHVINSGHIHDVHQYKRIYGNGSFFYLTHGYYKPKGFWKYTVEGDSFIAQFVENALAPRFLNIDCRGLSVEDAMTTIQVALGEHQWDVGSSIRIHAEKDNLILGQITSLKKAHNVIRWVTKQDSPMKTTSEDKQSEDSKQFISLEISPKTIKALLTERLRKRNLSPDVLQRASDIMESLPT